MKKCYWAAFDNESRNGTVFLFKFISQFDALCRLFRHRRKLISSVKHGKYVIKIFVPKRSIECTVYYSFFFKY